MTQITLRTHDLPDFVGAVNVTIQATSDAAFRQLIARTISFYAERLLNPHWGEQIVFRPGNVLAIAMVFQGSTSSRRRRSGARSSTGWRVRRRTSAS